MMQILRVEFFLRERTKLLEHCPKTKQPYHSVLSITRLASKGKTFDLSVTDGRK
jgi:hypothetical protein